MSIGLVCEGGGLRSIYTVGIMDYFIERGLEFEYTIGVSAGAIYIPSYISKQKNRSLKIQQNYLNDSRYMGMKYLLKKGTYINNEFTYYEIAKELIPFDYEAFKNSKSIYKAGAFNCNTGETEWFSKSKLKGIDDLLDVVIASGSLPFLSKKVCIEGKSYLDGGIGCPIPIDKAIEDGNSKNLVILTQANGYEKKPMKYKGLVNLAYRKYPEVAKALLKRHEVYNETLERVEKLEKIGDTFIMRPSKKVEVGRLEKNIEKIEELYWTGYEDAKKNYDRLIEWMK